MAKKQTSVYIEERTIEEADLLARRQGYLRDGEPNISNGIDRIADFHRWCRKNYPMMIDTFNSRPVAPAPEHDHPAVSKEPA